MKTKEILYKGTIYHTIKINSAIMAMIDKAIAGSLEFEKLTGKQLNITSTVGEIIACKKFKLDWVLNDINAGFDAFDEHGRTVQIKTRRYKGVRSSQTGNLLDSNDKVAFDYALLVLLNTDYTMLEIHEINSDSINTYLEPLNKTRLSQNRKVRKAISVSTFMSLAKKQIVNKGLL